MYAATKTFAMTALVLVLAACGSPEDANEGNFGEAVQAYLDMQNGLCAAIPADQIPFVLQDQATFPRRKSRAEALVDAGLLSKRSTGAQPMSGNGTASATEYRITDKGKRYLVTNAADRFTQQDAFCTGRYVLVDIEAFTAPSEAMGMKVSRVVYYYRAEGVADWAKTASLRAAYGNFSDPVQGDIAGRAVLVLTNEGWAHERLLGR